ncbi:uncharacterized protein K02A2.6-like [Papaver somniferum]|uniref:uncharacterized protein K02A2.6-like n=1 Tax=Papaver somniferum TaxID=3469 RepID=UPI000E6FE2F5|nr:uncharacterized protein K02A2.6-like [Papaver somniferum]
MAEELNLGAIDVKEDSKLVTNKISGDFQVKEAHLEPYRAEAQELIARRGSTVIEHTIKSINKHADALATLAAKIQLNEADEGTMVVKRSALPSTRKEDASFELKDDWRTTYIEDLTREADDQLLPVKVLKQFFVVRGALYFRKSGGALSRCVGKLEAQEILNRVHEESCGQTEGIPLYRWLQRMGVYWPNMEVQAAVVQDKCDDCQAPSQQTEICSVEIEDWRWGLDIIGPIKPTSSGHHKYIITATEYSSKWVEVIPLRDYSGTGNAAFIKEHIIGRFGAPMIIRSDNGTSFVNQTVIDLLDQYGIKFHTSTVYYPQGNGQAEATNKTLLRILSRMVHDHHRSWHEQLPLALWAYRISKRSSTGASPYSLVYGEYATLRAEIAIPFARVAVSSLTIPDERDEKAGKFAANWQGPYMISEAAESGYYNLKRMNSSRINTPINGKWLKIYYT